MRMTLAVAVAVLLFASVAHADGISVADGLVIPDGSTVTSVVQYYNTFFDGIAYSVSFSFADGTGEVSDSFASGQGEAGYLLFTNSVSDVVFNWEGRGFFAGDNAGDYWQAYPYVQNTSGTLEFAGFDTNGNYPSTPAEITILHFFSVSDKGGITSLMYAQNPPATVPEPSSLSLLGIGMAGILLWRERVPKIDVRGL